MLPSLILKSGNVLLPCCYPWIVGTALLHHVDLEPIICNIAPNLLTSYIPATTSWRDEINCYIDAAKGTRVATTCSCYVLEELPCKRVRGGTHCVPQFPILGDATHMQFFNQAFRRDVRASAIGERPWKARPVCIGHILETPPVAIQVMGSTQDAVLPLRC